MMKISSNTYLKAIMDDNDYLVLDTYNQIQSSIDCVSKSREQIERMEEMIINPTFALETKSPIE